jgi:hypothetical protein
MFTSDRISLTVIFTRRILNSKLHVHSYRSKLSKAQTQNTKNRIIHSIITMYQIYLFCCWSPKPEWVYPCMDVAIWDVVLGADKLKFCIRFPSGQEPQMQATMVNQNLIGCNQHHVNQIPWQWVNTYITSVLCQYFFNFCGHTHCHQKGVCQTWTLLLTVQYEIAAYTLNNFT